MPGFEGFVDVVAGDDGAFALGFGLGQALAQVEEEDGVKVVERQAAQEARGVLFAGVCLAGEGDLEVGVDDEFEEEFGELAADARFVL